MHPHAPPPSPKQRRAAAGRPCGRVQALPGPRRQHYPLHVLRLRLQGRRGAAVPGPLRRGAGRHPRHGARALRCDATACVDVWFVHLSSALVRARCAARRSLEPRLLRHRACRVQRRCMAGGRGGGRAAQQAPRGAVQCARRHLPPPSHAHHPPPPSGARHRQATANFKHELSALRSSFRFNEYDPMIQATTNPVAKVGPQRGPLRRRRGPEGAAWHADAMMLRPPRTAGPRARALTTHTRALTSTHYPPPQPSSGADRRDHGYRAQPGQP